MEVQNFFYLKFRVDSGCLQVNKWVCMQATCVKIKFREPVGWKCPCSYFSMGYDFCNRSYQKCIQHLRINKGEVSEMQVLFLHFFVSHKSCTLHKRPVRAVKVLGTCSIWTSHRFVHFSHADKPVSQWKLPKLPSRRPEQRPFKQPLLMKSQVNMRFRLPRSTRLHLCTAMQIFRTVRGLYVRNTWPLYVRWKFMQVKLWPLGSLICNDLRMVSFFHSWNFKTFDSWSWRRN